MTNIERGQALERQAVTLYRQYGFVLPGPAKAFFRELANYLQWHVWLHSTGHITAAELRTDGTPRIRATVGELTYQQKRNRLVPQNNLLVLDFIGDGNLMNMLDTSQITEALLRITTDAPDSLKAYIDYVSDIKLLK